MVSDSHPTGQNIDWLLENLKKTVPGTRQVLLLSSDGLSKAHVDLHGDDADRLAAIASGLNSLGRSFGHDRVLGNGGTVRQVIVELHNGILIVASAGHGAVLAVTADSSTHTETLGYEMGMLIRAVQPFLATPSRRPTSAPSRAGM
ncbi:roadblock/LC7 domain-containing protein [Streptomyces sp. NPDC002643]